MTTDIEQHTIHVCIIGQQQGDDISTLEINALIAVTCDHWVVCHRFGLDLFKGCDGQHFNCSDLILVRNKPLGMSAQICFDNQLCSLL